MMKIYSLAIVLFVLSGFCFQAGAQSVQKSSGVIKLNMKKTPVRAKIEAMPVAVPMEQNAVYELNSNGSNFTWITPTLSSVRTSKSNYHIEATVSSEEAIRFVNIFNNGQFITNKIPPVSTIRQMVVEEEMELELGKNDLRLEAVTVSGKKIESSVEVVYDISSAKYYALIIAVEEYSDELHPRTVYTADGDNMVGTMLVERYARENFWLFVIVIVALSGEWGWRYRKGLP